MAADVAGEASRADYDIVFWSATDAARSVFHSVWAVLDGTGESAVVSACSAAKSAGDAIGGGAIKQIIGYGVELLDGDCVQ